MRQPIDGKWLVIMAACLWGTTGTAQAFAPDGAQPAAIGTLRLLIGGAALFFLARTQGHLFLGKDWLRWSTLIAGVSVATYQLCFFAAVDRTGVAVGTIVGIGSAPIMGGLLGFWVHGESLSQRWYAATALAIAGCTLLISDSGSVDLDALGILLALGAGWSYATYATASKSLLAYHPPDAVMAVIFCIGALLLLPILLTVDLHWLPEPRGIIIALHLGLIATALSYILFARGLMTVSVGTTVTLSLAEPLTAGILGVVVLGESLTLSASLGISLLMCGLILLTINPLNRIRYNREHG